MTNSQSIALAMILSLIDQGFDYDAAEAQMRRTVIVGSLDLKAIRIAYEARRIADLERRADRAMGLAFLMPQAD